MPNYGSYSYAHAYEMGKRFRFKDKRIALVSHTETVDDEGASIEGYEAVAQVWAYVRQVDQTKRANSSAPYSEEEFLFYVNWRDDLVRAGDRPIRYVVHRGMVYEITRVDSYEGYRRDLALYAKTPGASGPRIEDISGL